MSFLKLENISVRYGDVFALRGISAEIQEGWITSLVGANGAGKSTVLRAVSGLIDCTEGAIRFEDRRIERLSTDERVELGLIQIPEGRLVFPYMTALENLEAGSMSRRSKHARKENLEKVMEMFPILRERRNQLANTLSGGEQQMLAIARGLMAKPRLLMLDEPSLGLSPLLVKEIFQTLRRINEQGMTILLVEQNVRHSLEIARYGYVLENGRLVLSSPARELLQNDHVRKAYLGLLKK
jgi:branched-chain amino acid transport system ATP-binding protein